MVDFRRLRQANDIIAVLEDGDFNAAVTQENEKLLGALADLAPPKGKAVKGTLTIAIAYEVVGNQVEVSAAVTSKAPKPVRGHSNFFLNADHSLNTEHPKQTSIFDDPKVRPMTSAAE